VRGEKYGTLLEIHGVPKGQNEKNKWPYIDQSIVKEVRRKSDRHVYASITLGGTS
jgi:hypothetical protein